MSVPDVNDLRKLLASKHHCSPELHRVGVQVLGDLERALEQACMNLATIRPLDVMEPGEDLSLGECKERWLALVKSQTLEASRVAGREAS